MELILGSKSPYRRKLLESSGIVFKCEVAEVEEKSVVGKTPKDTAFLRAQLKAENIGRNFPGTIVIGADQTLDFKGKCINKAMNEDEAFRYLVEFSGYTHTLHSAVYIKYFPKNDNEKEKINWFIKDIVMEMRSLSENEIKNYILTDEWKGCVGCYQVENKGVNLFSKIGGDISEIIGLPLLETLKILREFGINPLSKK